MLDEESLLRTYRETVHPLYAFVSRRVGGNTGLAEDLVQETWLRALDTWPSRGVPAEPLAWLIRVAHNTLVDHFRRIQPQAIDTSHIDLEAPAPDVDAAGAAVVVGWGLARLRRRHAEVLEAFYFDGKSVREIARERAASERAIEGRLRRARAKLKKHIEKLRRGQISRRTEGAGEGTPHRSSEGAKAGAIRHAR